MKFKILSIEFDNKLSPKEISITTTDGPFSLKEATTLVSALENANPNCISICVPVRETTLILKDLKRAVGSVIHTEILAKKKRIANAKKKR